MLLRGKTARAGNLDDRSIRVLQHPAGSLDPLFDDEVVRRASSPKLNGVIDELQRQVHCARHVRARELVFEILFDVVAKSGELPIRQSIPARRGAYVKLAHRFNVSAESEELKFERV